VTVGEEKVPQPVPQPRRTPGPVVAMPPPRRVRVRAVTVEMVTVRMPASGGPPRTATTTVVVMRTDVVIGQRAMGIDVMRCGRVLVVVGGRPGVVAWRPVLRRAAGEGLAHVGTCPFCASGRTHAPPARGLQPTSSVQGRGRVAEDARDGCGRSAAAGWTPYRP
jgi:hypothetical protein